MAVTPSGCLGGPLQRASVHGVGTTVARYCIAYRDPDDGMREVYLDDVHQPRSDGVTCGWVREQEDALVLEWHQAAALLCAMGLGDDLYLVEATC